MIYILSPTAVATGGTELLQQLCYALNNLNISAQMYYVDQYDGSPVQQKFEPYYHNPTADHIENCTDNAVVVPETLFSYVLKNRQIFSKMKTYLWWLSVDNYIPPKGNRSFRMKLLDCVLHHALFRSSTHLVQSEYARLHILSSYRVPADRILYLSDYLNRDYFQLPPVFQKNDVILYNPRKGFAFTSALKEHIPEYEWVALSGLTNIQMRQLLTTSKLYVDFGNHPGKDRIPRESCVCGCCIITGKQGAAANPVDIPIPEEFKFDDTAENFEAIHQKIISCMTDFEAQSAKFTPYRERTKAEEANFIQDAETIFSAYRK